MKYSNHYLNQKTGRFACACDRMNRKSISQIRNWTSNKDEVTCKKCLNQLLKWKENKNEQQRKMQ
jgi:hypothetical protein